MKFAHIADCHIGSWRDPILKDISLRAFQNAVDICMAEQVDFVLIAGDLFNTAFPPIDHLKEAVSKFRQLKEKGIPTYMIAGSHDYSPSGKTMLDVLENAGLTINVARGEEVEGRLRLRFTVDPKTGAKITGILGKMGALEKRYFENLIREPLEEEKGYKIFLFHALLTELKPRSLADVESYGMSLLPKHFDYYAGGHPHFVYSGTQKDYGRMAYTGPLFPNSFSELEELGHGGFFIIENGNSRRLDIKLNETLKFHLDCNHKSAEQAQEEMLHAVRDVKATNAIVLIRLSGTLSSGRPSDIRYTDVFDILKQNGAYCVLKNSSMLCSEEFEEIRIEAKDRNSIEENLIREHIPTESLRGKGRDVCKSMINALDTEKQESETVPTFQRRLTEEMDKILG